jgi:hypothetical protein
MGFFSRISSDGVYVYDADRKKRKQPAWSCIMVINERPKHNLSSATSRQIVSAVGCQLSLDVHLGRSHLEHSLKVLLGLRNVLEVVEIIGLGHSAKHLSDDLAVVHPLFNERLDRGLLWLWGRHRLD